VSENQRLTISPSRLPSTQVIAGRSLNSIVREWRECEILTSRGNPWTARTLKLALNNPRLCGWRRLGADLVRDAGGNPIVGEWEPIVTPGQWLAVHAVLEARRGMQVGTTGVLHELPADFREHKYLLTGTLRCGRIRPDGSMCGARLRVQRNRDCVQHIYSCPPKTANGCGGLGRRGDKVDEFVTEAVLAKLEERQAVPAESEPWSGEDELSRLETKLATLRQQWTADEITDGFFFTTVRQVEQRVQGLRNEQARRTATELRSRSTFADVRQRWYGNKLDMSQKRAYVREALHAVIVHPIGRGGRAPFNPDLLEPIWRE